MGCSVTFLNARIADFQALYADRVDFRVADLHVDLDLAGGGFVLSRRYFLGRQKARAGTVVGFADEVTVAGGWQRPASSRRRGSFDRPAVQRVRGAEQGQDLEQARSIVAGAEDPVFARRGDLAAVIESEIGEPPAAGGRNLQLRIGEQDVGADPGVIVFVNRSPHIVDQPLRRSGVLRAVAQVVEVLRQIEESAGNVGHPAFVFAGSGATAHPGFKRRVGRVGEKGGRFGLSPGGSGAIHRFASREFHVPDSHVPSLHLPSLHFRVQALEYIN